MKNIVVTAYKGVGKTTLIKRIIEDTDRNIYGFYTQKFPDRLIDGLCPIYIYPAAGEPVFDDDHLVGLGGEGTHYINTEVFDSLGVELISTDDQNGLIVMDEVGFLECKAEKFQQKVFDCLAGDIPTVVIMKSKMQQEFMQKLAAFPDIEFITMDEENRDEVYERIRKRLHSL